jgi:2-polyprenyl-3-methyl-5-hydroxy-6-metoxy-1,4-benzoquinol methylase
MKKSPFRVEEERARLAAKGKLSELRRMYSTHMPEIPDLNSATFWDERLIKRMPLSKQDGMTQDRARLAARLVPMSARNILDIGIGPGWVEELLEHRGIDLYGTDISEETIKNMKQRFPKDHFSVESLYDLHRQKRKYDAVIMLEVLEHVPPSRTFKVLHDIYSILNDNGHFILSVPMNEGLETMSDNPNGHVRMYTEPLIKSELQITGFTVIRTTTLYAFPTLYMLKNLLAKTILSNHWKPNNIVVLAQKTK